MSDLRGAAQLAVDGVVGVTDIVERMYSTISRLSTFAGVPETRPARGIAGWVHGAVRGVARSVGRGVDGTLRRFDGRWPVDWLQRDHVVAALNGVLGDRLAARANPLATAMQLRPAGIGGSPWADAPGMAPPGFPPSRQRRIAVFVHGLCLHEGHWDPGYATALRELGYGSVYLRYNTGRHIADNGESLSHALDALMATTPAELTLIGHSMGGLVSRSACDFAERTHAPWRRALRNLVTLGTPHHGAVLERAGRRIDVALTMSPWTAPFASLGGVRSAGIKDLGDGRVRRDGALAPLPQGVRCFALAGSLRRGGDGLVSLDSALGRNGLAFGDTRRRVIEGAGHLDLLNHDGVRDALASWLAPAKAPRQRRGG